LYPTVATVSFGHRTIEPKFSRVCIVLLDKLVFFGGIYNIL